MSVDQRPAALARLRNSLVCVLHAECLGGDTTAPAVITARVFSTRDDRRLPYIVELTNDRWTCSCGSGECCHLHAVRMVTGHQGCAA